MSYDDKGFWGSIIIAVIVGFVIGISMGTYFLLIIDGFNHCHRHK